MNFHFHLNFSEVFLPLVIREAYIMFIPWSLEATQYSVAPKFLAYSHQMVFLKSCYLR